MIEGTAATCATERLVARAPSRCSCSFPNTFSSRPLQESRSEAILPSCAVRQPCQLQRQRKRGSLSVCVCPFEFENSERCHRGHRRTIISAHAVCACRHSDSIIIISFSLCWQSAFPSTWARPGSRPGTSAGSCTAWSTASRPTASSRPARPPAEPPGRRPTTPSTRFSAKHRPDGTFQGPSLSTSSRPCATKVRCRNEG
jgi:hypothetical protein